MQITSRQKLEDFVKPGCQSEARTLVALQLPTCSLRCFISSVEDFGK